MSNEQKRNKRAIANLRREEANTRAMELKGTRARAQNRRQNLGGRGSASSASEEFLANAAWYALSIRYPFLVQGQRIPDLSRANTSVATAQQYLEIPTSLTTDTNSTCGGVIIAPNTKAGLVTIPAGATAFTMGTKALADWTIQTGVAANAFLYRVVSMGFYLENCAKLYDRGGRIYINNQLTWLQANGLTRAALVQHPATVLLDGGDSGEKIEAVWFPLTLQAMVVDAASTRRTSAATFRDPSTAEIEDLCIVIWFETGDTTISEDLIGRAILNYEFVPIVANSNLFEARTAMGDPHSVAVAWQQTDPGKNVANQSMGTSVSESVRVHNEGGFMDTLMSGAKSALGFVTGTRGARALFKGAMSALSLPAKFGFGQRLLGGALGALGSLGGLLTPRDMENHYLAVGYGMVDLSPVHNESLQGLTFKEFQRRLDREKAMREEPAEMKAE